MKISAVQELKKRKKADLLILPFWQGKKGAEPTRSFKEFATLYDGPLEMGDFLGKEGEILFLYQSENSHEPRVMLLGLGEEKKCSEEVLRRTFATAVKAIAKKKLSRLNVCVAPNLQQKAIVEGILLTNYHYLHLKRHALKDAPYAFIESICLVGEKAEEHTETAKLIDAVNLTRDLVNGNADDTNADALAKEAKELALKHSKLKVRILRKKELEAEKMGLMLAVNRGASVEPALIIFEYKGDQKSDKQIAIVGKGVTFDTGGLNIKPTGGIETMKCDMAGGAAVFGVIRAAAELGLKVNLVGVVVAVENAVGPESYKPGDVYVSHAGKTVEISNTDAEGRLVLADAFSYLKTHYKVERIVDLATLTGGVVVALGEDITGMFANDESLASELTAAGLKTGERVWRLPLLTEYKEKLKSSIADIRNTGPRGVASAPIAAVFLQQFVENTPWAHLDIAGTAYLSEPKHYHQTPATGVGVRLLIEWLQSL